MTEREQFEAEYRKRSDRDDDDVEESLRLGKDGEYIYDGTWTAFYWWQAARAKSPQVPKGMALVPVDTISKTLHGLEHLKADIQDRSKLQEDYQEGVVMVGAGAWHALCSAILMLAAAKEPQCPK